MYCLMIKRYVRSLESIRKLFPFTRPEPKIPSEGFIRGWLREFGGHTTTPERIELVRHNAGTPEKINHFYDHVFTKEIANRVNKLLYFNCDETMIQAGKKFKVISFSQSKA